MPARNEVLRSFTTPQIRSLTLEQTRLPAGSVLFRTDEPVPHLIFVATGLISLIRRVSDGGAIEIFNNNPHNLVLGAHTLFQDHPASLFDYVVRVEGVGFRTQRTHVLNLIRRDPALRDRLKQTVEEGYDAVVQSHACLGHHSAENRLCGMLLRARQMLSQNRIPFDHGTIGDILTYHPVYVTRLMKKLSRAGLIEVGRGHIVIIDPAALARRACDCYDWLTRKILPV